MVLRFASSAVALASLVGSATGAIVPFTETFSADASNWTGSAGPAIWDPAGSISADTNVNAASFGVVIGLRGQLANNASNGAFAGNWIAQGVTAFSFSIRHDAPVPMNFGARLVTPANFPAAIGLDFAPVLPGQWTIVTIPISPTYPGFVSFEGSDFNTIFSSIGSVQLLYSVPQALAGTGTIVRFEADNVRIVPTPGTAGLLAASMLILRRRR